MAEPGTTENTTSATAVLEAPASSAAPAASSEPITARQAVEAAFTKAEADPSPASPPPAGSGSPAAPTPAATSPAADAKPPASNVIPFDRHESALRNARTEGQRAIDDLKAKVGWAEGVTKADFDSAMALARSLHTNPQAFYEQLGREIQATPQTTSALADPEPDLVSQDGKHRAFSAEKVVVLLKNTEARVKSAILSELRPTIDFATNGQRQAEVATITEQSRTFAREIMQECETSLRHFKENKEAIGVKFAAIDPAVKAKVGTVAALHMAYHQVLDEKVWPTIQGQAETTVRSEMQKQAATSMGTVGAGTGGSAAVKRPTNPQELARYMASMEGASAL